MPRTGHFDSAVGLVLEQSDCHRLDEGRTGKTSSCTRRDVDVVECRSEASRPAQEVPNQSWTDLPAHRPGPRCTVGRMIAKRTALGRSGGRTGEMNRFYLRGPTSATVGTADPAGQLGPRPNKATSKRR